MAQTEKSAKNDELLQLDDQPLQTPKTSAANLSKAKKSDVTESIPFNDEPLKASSCHLNGEEGCDVCE